MRKIFMLLFFWTIIGHSQSGNPVSWTTNAVKISDDVYELVIIATLESDYRLYTQTVPNNGPLPTVFNFQKSKNYILVDGVKESAGNNAFDPAFQLEIKSFRNRAIFKQRIKTTKNKSFKINGEITFMICNDKTCSRGKQKIEFKI